MHRRLGSATLSQPAYPRESNPNFPSENSQCDNIVRIFFFFNKKKEREKKKEKIWAVWIKENEGEDE